MPELDISRAPRGVLAAQRLVAAVAEQGDLAERHYLELKSELDLSTKKDKEKIAKFILGAANRMPDVAATAFEGYGVMIIGVKQGAITGIPPIEMMEISKVIQKYVGAAGPRWDIVWVPIDDSLNQVLAILVEPPKLGQGPFPCRANGDSLTDVRIYIRADGETREANSGEVDLLIQRGSSSAQVEVDFAVEVLGDVASFTIDEEGTVDEYIGRVRVLLFGAMPGAEQPVLDAEAHTKRTVGLSAYRATAALSPVASMFKEPERRTQKEYIESINRWETSFRKAWKAGLPKIEASQLCPTVVKITNQTTTFFHDVEVKLHLEGDVFALDYYAPECANGFGNLKLPRPPRQWGPTQPSYGLSGYANMARFDTPSLAPYVPSSISYKNDGSVNLSLNVGELRPRGTYESEDEEIVLVVTDRSLASIHGTWELTARGHNDIYTGEIDIPVTGNRDITEAARAILKLRDDAEEGVDI